MKLYHVSFVALLMLSMLCAAAIWSHWFKENLLEFVGYLGLMVWCGLRMGHIWTNMIVPDTPVRSVGPVQAMLHLSLLSIGLGMAQWRIKNSRVWPAVKKRAAQAFINVTALGFAAALGTVYIVRHG